MRTKTLVVNAIEQLVRQQNGARKSLMESFVSDTWNLN